MDRRIAGLALLATALLAPGCGGGGGEARTPVHPTGGKVTLDGRPAARFVIRFHPVAPGAAPAGGPEVGTLVTETGDDGLYRLSTYAADDGAPAGEYVVTARPAVPSVEDRDGPARPAAAPTGALAKYADRATSPLKATVKPGDNPIDFELK